MKLVFPASFSLRFVNYNNHVVNVCVCVSVCVPVCVCVCVCVCVWWGWGVCWGAGRVSSSRAPLLGVCLCSGAVCVCVCLVTFKKCFQLDSKGERRSASAPVCAERESVCRRV